MKQQVGSPKPRLYRMRKRAQLVDETRARITQAAVRLHTTVGPSAASMTAVAEEAGVTRLTLYRHFSTKDELFSACMGHWLALHPPPDADAWRRIPQFQERLTVALAELYRWYDENGAELYPIYRDAEHTPESNQRARQAANQRMADAILGDGGRGADRQVRAAVGHAIGFWTWRSLVVEQGLSTAEATATAVRFVLATMP